MIVETNSRRIKVADTDSGRELKMRIAWLQKLLKAYEDGVLVEK